LYGERLARQNAVNFYQFKIDVLKMYIPFNPPELDQYYVLSKSSYFFHRIEDEQVVHGHSTRFRTAEMLNGPMPHQSKYMYTFYYQSVKDWNLLPRQVRDMPSFGSFRVKVKSHLVDLLGRP
jgi:hypothetical protein